MLIRAVVVLAFLAAAGCGDVPVSAGEGSEGGLPHRVEEAEGDEVSSPEAPESPSDAGADGGEADACLLDDAGTEGLSEADGGGSGDDGEGGEDDDDEDSDSDSVEGEGEDDEAAAHDRECLCHKDRKTLCLPLPAVDAHLGHGDSLGACEE